MILSAGLRIEKAREALEAGRPAKALALLKTGLDKPALVPSILRADWLFIGAEAWRDQGFFNHAQSIYSKLLGQSPASDPALYIESALGSASCHRSLGETAPARARLAQAQKLAARSKMRAFSDRIELESALIDRAAGEYAKSIKSLNVILKQRQRSGDLQGAGYLYWALGGALRFHGKLKESQDAFERSLGQFKKAGDGIGQGYALFGLGGIARIRGQLRGAAGYYANASKLFARTDDVFAKAYAFCGYANALRQLGKLSEAERGYKNSFKLYAQLGDLVDLAYVEWGLGKIHLHRGELEAAKRRLTRADELFSRYNEHRGEVLSKVALAQALHALGETKRAEKTFLKGYRLAGRAGLHAHLEVYT